MDQYNQNKANGLKSRLEFEKEREKEMDFYVPVGAIFIGVDGSDNAIEIEYKKLEPVLRQLISSIRKNGGLN